MKDTKFKIGQTIKVTDLVVGGTFTGEIKDIACYQNEQMYWMHTGRFGDSLEGIPTENSASTAYKIEDITC